MLRDWLQPARCPSCQAFQPAYEAVASYFHAEPKVQPEVWVARVDCAEEVHRHLYLFLACMHACNISYAVQLRNSHCF